MGSRTMENDPLQVFRFKLEFGTDEIGARTVNGLEKEFEVAEYREGGYSSGVRKIPGIPETGVLTVEKGVFRDIDAYNRLKETQDNNDFRFSVTVTEKDRHGNPVRQWELEEAWISKLEGPEFDAESSDVSVEEMEIQYEDIQMELLV